MSQRLVVLCAAVLVSSAISVAQAPKTDQPFEQFAPYWTLEPGWHTEIQLRNNLNRDLTISPSLRLSDATEIRVPDVVIRSNEVRSIQLSEAAPSLAGKVGSFGSAVFRYNAPVPRALYAAAMIHAAGQPIAFHSDAGFNAVKHQVGSVDSIWWLPRDVAADQFIITNHGDKHVVGNLVLSDASGKQSKQAIPLAPHTTTRIAIKDLIAGGKLAGNFGGLSLHLPANAGAVDTLHLLYDTSTGFSAMLKTFDTHPDADLRERSHGGVKQWTIRAPMLALTNPDPALGFPPETKLKPQLFIRNVSNKNVNAILRFTWHAADRSAISNGPTLALGAKETKVIDVSSLQAQNILPGDANWAMVTIVTDSRPDELLAIAASFDETGRFGAQTPFSDQLSAHWTGGKWEADANKNTIMAIGNGGTKQTRALLTIFYNQGADKYELEQTLSPDEQMMVNVGQLIRTRIPDRSGRLLPPDLTSGTYELRDLADNQGNVFEGKVIIDKTFGHAAYGCMICCGYIGDRMNPAPTFGPLGFINTAQILADDACSYETGVDISNAYLSWWSGNTSIVGVSYGQVNGVGPGTTLAYANGNPQRGDGQAYPRSCPAPSTTEDAEADVFNLSCNSPVVRGSTVTCTVSAPAGSTFSGWKFSAGSETVQAANNSSNSWSGPLVKAGTISVTATYGNANVQLSANVSVTPRSCPRTSALLPEVVSLFRLRLLRKYPPLRLAIHTPLFRRMGRS